MRMAFGKVVVSLGTRERSVLNLFKSFLNKMPLSVYRNYHRKLKTEIDRIASGYDVIFVDHFIMAAYVDNAFFDKTIFHQHNAEFKMWRSFADIQKNKINKIILKLESWRVKRYEKFYCNNFYKTFAAPNDITQLMQVGVNRDKLLKTYHLGSSLPADYDKHRFEQTQNKILYVGSLAWQANNDGLIWFLETIWPEFQKNYPEVVLNIAGKGASCELIQLVDNSQCVNLWLCG